MVAQRGAVRRPRERIGGGTRKSLALTLRLLMTTGQRLPLPPLARGQLRETAGPYVTPYCRIAHRQSYAMIFEPIDEIFGVFAPLVRADGRFRLRLCALYSGFQVCGD